MSFTTVIRTPLQTIASSRWLNRPAGSEGLDRVDAERPPVDLLKPYEAAQMDAHPVDPRVRNNGPGLCTLWDCPQNSQ